MVTLSDQDVEILQQQLTDLRESVMQASNRLETAARRISLTSDTDQDRILSSRLTAAAFRLEQSLNQIESIKSHFENA